MYEKNSMAHDTVFLNSYALIEIIKGNPRYQHYMHTFIVTTQLNLFEVAYTLLREGAHDIQPIITRYSSYITNFGNDLIIAAASFKLQHKKRRLSMVDCIGYCLARTMGIPFVTGDQQFKDMENVHFLPKD